MQDREPPQRDALRGLFPFESSFTTAPQPQPLIERMRRACLCIMHSALRVFGSRVVSRSGARVRRTVVALCAMLPLAPACSRDMNPTYHAHDPVLQQLPLYIYPAAGADSAHPRALILFFGNDVGFWTAHRDLASSLARRGYTVVGMSLRGMLDNLPDDSPARDSAFAARMQLLTAHAERELGAVGVPVVVGGHSVGAELAIWVGAHVPLPHLEGVLALSPGSRSHLRVTAGDLAMAEPTGADSYSLISTVASTPSNVRITLVRGQRDQFAAFDTGYVAVGGTRLRRYVVKFAGHSLKRMLLAKPKIAEGVEWMVAPRS